MEDSNIEQIYTNCLAQGAYFIESEGEAVVIDPLRETAPYIKRAKERGVNIKYIFETHFHADFVSGHLDLAKETGAQIVYGPKAETEFEKYSAKDGEVFHVGKLTFKVLHTPGHTPESTSYLLFNEKGKEHAIFTGDTLFIGDVGRPDLAQANTGLTQEDLAGWLFDSLRNKIMTLPDDIIIYPAHGAGSSCGKNMSSETWDTLGNQRKTNYALRADMTKTEFIAEVTDGLIQPPNYFSKNALLNKKGYTPIENIINKGQNALTVEQFDAFIKNKEVLILDVRSKESFIQGHIPGSLFIGLDGTFAPWVGALIKNLNQKIAIVAPDCRAEETVIRLARVGYDNSIGYLAGGFEAWIKAGMDVRKIQTLTVADFITQQEVDPIREILDVRKPSEFEITHLQKAITYPLDFFLGNDHKSLSKSQPYYLHCRSGYRSTIASSLLMKAGFTDLINVVGSFEDIKNSDLPVEGSCPSLVTT